MRQYELWERCLHLLKTKQAFALLIVVDSKGSSPGKLATKMAISADECFGTIGGGQIEYDLSRQARVLLQQEKSSSRLFYEVHNGVKQVCGGRQTVLFYHCTLDDLAVFQAIKLAVQKKMTLQLCLSPDGLTLEESPEQALQIEFKDHKDSGWRYRELIGKAKTAYIIGAGHVGLALSQVLSMLDFEIILIDQRPAVQSFVDNTYASKKIIVPYTEVTDYVYQGLNSYVFIMTHSHKTDQLVLQALFNQEYAYLGVLGSRAKIKVMQKNLAAVIEQQDWESIHAPIGLAIHSQSPMEIAVSIAAEVISEQ
ncbi:MAG: hypothetical protein GQ582_08275 [Methyloprofundus sp.]|nr:hypothetical protein [Methyloprofundus sp.]